MDNPKLIAELEVRRRDIISRRGKFDGYLKNLDAVIDLLTQFSPVEIARRAFDKEPEKIWFAREITDELIAAHDDGKLDTRGLGGKKWMRISHNALINLFRGREVERIAKGQYRKRKLVPETKQDRKIEEASFDEVVVALMAVPKKRLGQKYAGLVPFSEMQVGHSIFLRQEGRVEIGVMQTCIRAEASRHGCTIITQREKAGLNVIIKGRPGENGQIEKNRLMHCYYCRKEVHSAHKGNCPHCKKPKVLIK